MYSRGKQGICGCSKRRQCRITPNKLICTFLAYAITGTITHTHTIQEKLEIAQRDKKRLRISDLFIPGTIGGPAQPKCLGRGMWEKTEGVYDVGVKGASVVQHVMQPGVRRRCEV